MKSNFNFVSLIPPTAIKTLSSLLNINKKLAQLAESVGHFLFSERPTHNSYSLLGGCWGKTNQVYNISLKCKNGRNTFHLQPYDGVQFPNEAVFLVSALLSLGGRGQTLSLTTSKMLQSLQSS